MREMETVVRYGFDSDQEPDDILIVIGTLSQ